MKNCTPFGQSSLDPGKASLAFVSTYLSNFSLNFQPGCSSVHWQPTKQNEQFPARKSYHNIKASWEITVSQHKRNQMSHAQRIQRWFPTKLVLLSLSISPVIAVRVAFIKQERGKFGPFPANMISCSAHACYKWRGNKNDVLPLNHNPLYDYQQTQFTSSSASLKRFEMQVYSPHASAHQHPENLPPSHG